MCIRDSFKAVVRDGLVKAVGVEFFNSAVEAQALYKLKQKDWEIWLNKICAMCEADQRNCYAEVALNAVTDECVIEAYDVKDRLAPRSIRPKIWRTCAVSCQKLKAERCTCAFPRM